MCFVAFLNYMYRGHFWLVCANGLSSGMHTVDKMHMFVNCRDLPLWLHCGDDSSALSVPEVSSDLQLGNRYQN